VGQKGSVVTLALGSRPRQTGCKVASPEEVRELNQEEARELSQEEARELSQEEARELRQEEARESHHILPGMLESVREYEGVNLHTPKATPTLGDGVPVDSRWTPKTSESDCKGQTSMSCGVPYIIGKLLKRRCLKWARIAHLDI